jgi:hypothetical protein
LFEDRLLRVAHPHTHTGLQQQQHGVEVVLGIIVMKYSLQDFVP